MSLSIGRARAIQVARAEALPCSSLVAGRPRRAAHAQGVQALCKVRQAPVFQRSTTIYPELALVMLSLAICYTCRTCWVVSGYVIRTH